MTLAAITRKLEAAGYEDVAFIPSGGLSAADDPVKVLDKTTTALTTLPVTCTSIFDPLKPTIYPELERQSMPGKQQRRGTHA